jgi:hypothetical protein
MTQSIDLVTKFLALLDTVYKLESKTAQLDALTQSPEFLGANEIKVMQLSTVGLGTYDRATGYPSGDITAEWVTMTLAAERGRAFSLDRMDNEESLGLVLGRLINEWMRVHVAPEIDAYRFAKYATGAGQVVSAGATLTKDTIEAAIDVATLAMNEAEVPEEGRKLYMSMTCKQFLEQAIGRELANENRVNTKVQVYNDMEVIGVPQGRFYTQITLNAGATSDAGGYAKTSSTGKDINFMIIHPTAVCQPIKLNNLKYFSPEVNQQSDGHLWQYRLYHDAFVYDNKENGIYLHHKA